jgi:hypothetical protein
MAKKALSQEVVESFNSALSLLTGHARRQYAAGLCEKFFDNSPREMEKVLKVGRQMVKLGLDERRTGILCMDALSLRGAKKKKKPTLV